MKTRLFKIAVSAMSATAVCVAAAALAGCAPQELKYDAAIKIAKSDFGCEKILWITSEALSDKPLAPFDGDPYKQKSPYTYYIVGEKAGQEVYIVVPCRPDLEKAFSSGWSLDFSFAEVVEKFNEHGAGYTADIPDDYYAAEHNYITIKNTARWINDCAEYYNVGCDGDAFYDRLDIKSVFYYQWMDGEKAHSCIVTQEDHGLKAYAK